jgi:hypothetical protein
MSFYRLLLRPYWERLWIIQELAMGDDTTLMMCGSHRLRWGEIYDVARLVAATLNSLRDVFRQEIGDEAFAHLSTQLWLICQLHEVRAAASGDVQIDAVDRILRLGQSAAATEPRDKVYGLLGLIDSTISSRITPDYSLPIQAVYTNFAKSFIEATGSLRIILIGGRLGLSEDWPSWVPNWTLGFDRYHPSFNAPYRASGSTLARVNFVHLDEHLCCEGFRIGTVPVSREYQRRESPSQLHGSGHQFGDEEALFTGFWGDVNRLVAESSDNTPRRSYNPETDEQEMEEKIRPNTRPGPWQDNYRHNRSEAFEYYFHGGMVFDLLMGRKPERIREQLPLAAETFDTVIEMMGNRIDVAKVRGHAVYATESVEKDDVICILLGCHYPVILRGCGEQMYKLVGECYSPHLMQGETMQWLDSGECQIETFTIC